MKIDDEEEKTVTKNKFMQEKRRALNVNTIKINNQKRNKVKKIKVMDIFSEIKWGSLIYFDVESML